MKLGFKYWLISGAVCVAGAIIFAVGCAIGDNGNSNSKTFSTYVDPATAISIDIENASVDLVVSESANDIFVQFSHVEGNPKAETVNNTLTISNDVSKHFMSFGGIGKKGKVTITVPDTVYDKITLKLNGSTNNSMSDVRVNGLSVDLNAANTNMINVTVLETMTTFDIDASKLEVNRCKLPGAEIDFDAANVNINNCEFSGDVELLADASDVDFDSCIFTSRFNITADAADVDVKSITLDGDMTITADASSVDVSIAGNAEKYNVAASNNASTIKVNGSKDFILNSSAEHNIQIHGSASTVNVDFKGAAE